MSRKAKYFIILFLSIILMPLGVSAKENMQLEVDKTKLQSGDSVVVTIDLDYSNPLYAFTAGLSFDNSVFEMLETHNFKEEDDWSDIVYNNENKKFALINKSGNQKDHLLRVKLVVKDNPVSGKTEISVNSPIGSNGKKDIEFNSVSKTLTIENTSKKKADSSYYKKQDNVKKDTNFKTFRPFIIIGIVLIVILLIGIILLNLSVLKNSLFIKKGYRKKVNITLSIILIIILVITIVLAILNGNRVDINGDGQKDYDDAKNINEYLIDITNKKENEKRETDKKTDNATNNIKKLLNIKNNLDVNGDGKITITDTAKYVKEHTKNTKYKVELKKSDIDYYPEKKENVELNFTAKINPNDVKIKEVYVNGKKVKVILDENIYSVIVKASDKSGIQKYTITKVVLTNGREIDVKDLTFTIDVLKTKPKIENFNYENNNINFDIKDSDKALKEASIKIVKGIASVDDLKTKEPESVVPDNNNPINPENDDFDSIEVIFEKNLNINSKEQDIDVDFELGGVYTLLIVGNYDLDTNKIDSSSNYYENQELYFGTITNGKVTITPITELDELYPKQKQAINFEFEASLQPITMNQSITKVVIDGEEKEVIYEDGHYTLVLDGSNSYGEKNHEISSVILNDDTRVLCHYEIVYEVLKIEPKFTSFVYHDSEDRITFTLDDIDNSVHDAKIVITEKDESDPIFEDDLDLNKDYFRYDGVGLEKGNKYDVEITGAYDLDGYRDNDKNDFEGSLFNHELTVHDLSLAHAEDSTYYVNKAGQVELKFKATVEPEDTGSVVTEVTIGNKTYSPNRYRDGTYGIVITAPEEAGKKEYKITKVVLGDDEISKELSFNVDVLKDKPTIENINIDEVEDPFITFTLKDPEGALKTNAGEIVIRNSAKEEEKRVQIKKDDNHIDLSTLSDLESGGTYYFDINVNYDLDSEQDNNKNDKFESLIKDNEIKIYKANLNLSNKNNLYFKKGEIGPVYINASINPSDSVKIKEFIMEDGTLVKANEKDGVYSLDIEANDEAGEDSYSISKVVLDNNISIKAALNFKIDVLKDVPYINKLNIDDDNESLSYELVDVDGAFKDGSIYINDHTNSNVKNELVSAKTPKATVEYPFNPDEIYYVKVLGSYSLSDDSTHVHDNEEMYIHSFKIGGDYNFKLTDAYITDAVKKEERPVITFTSTNTRGAKIQNVTIDGEKYKVTSSNGNEYKILLDNADMNFGKHEVNLNSVELNTLKSYTNGEDYNVNKLTYTVLKDAPAITNIELANNSSNKTITAHFDLNDYESLTKLMAVLVDSSGKIVTTKEILMEEIYSDSGITLSYDKNTDGYYTVKFLADYDLGDKYKYTAKNIGEDKIFTQSDQIYIKNISLKKSKYVNKGQKNYEISYDVFVGENIKTNNNKNYTRLSAITVNGTNYVANQESGYQSKIGITVPDKSGVFKLTANRVQLELNSYYDKVNNYYSVPEKSIEIEVLKDVPQIENLKITKEDYVNKSVTLEFDVKLDENAKKDDESFINGSVEFGSVKHDIKRGHNEITLNDITTDANLDLVFRASYDLDTDELNSSDSDDVNQYTNQIINSAKYGLFAVDNYQDISIVKDEAISEDGDQYFEKDEKIKLNFNFEGLSNDAGLTPKKLIIKGKEYNLTKAENGYEIILDGYNTFGTKAIEITDIVLNNGKTINLEKPYIVEVEVLKDKPQIIDYNYDVSDKITITSNLKDYDGAIVGKAHVKVTDEDGSILYDKDYSDEITFAKKDGISRYYVEIVVDYDRDTDVATDSDNYYKKVKLLDEIISLEINKIELKDIFDINLYEVEKNGTSENIKIRDKVNFNDIRDNKENYFVEVNMENMPSIHAKIKEVKNDQDQLILILDYKYVIKEGSKEPISINFGRIENGVVNNETHPDLAFKSLIEKLKNNDHVTLNQNYDASAISVEDATYVGEFTGTLNGNGYTIKNLSRPLFDTLTNATIENLNIQNVTLSSANDRGALANKANKSNIKNVLISDITRNVTPNGHQNGGLIGLVRDSSTIENSRVINAYLNIGDRQQSGGFVGALDNSKVNNCYVSGTISASWNFIGGFAGNVSNSEIKNSYAKVSLGGAISCGFACSNNNSVYKNNVALSTGARTTNFVNNYKTLENNFVVVDNNSDSSTNGLTNITKDQVNDELFTSRLNFDRDIWNIKDVSYNNLPIFNIEKVIKINVDEVGKEYDEDKEILYDNLMLLMPFYDSTKIVESAKNITNDNLNNKKIAHVVPLDSKGNIVTYLTSDNVKKISKIKIVYKSGEKDEYKVTYDNTYDMVASYRIPELKIDYNYNHYIIDVNSQVVKELTNYLRGLDYTENLDVLTSTEDSRIYRDFYNETTSKELEEFVLKFLSNSNYTNTINDENINSYLESEVKKDKKIEKVLYMYNYFRRFYDLEIEGIKLYDFMLFKMEGFDTYLTPSKIADLYLADGNNFNTGATGTKYETILGKYTKLDKISKFIEYMVTEFGDGNLDEWTRKQFKGYLVEIPIKDAKNVQYTLWDHFINEDANYKPHRAYDMMLPILTLPKNAAYIISTPVQYVIGAQRSYIVDPEDAQQQDILRRRIKSYADRMATYYSTAYKILGDEKLFNDIHTFHLDKRFAYDENGAMVYQQVGTEEPFHKNFNEVTNRWQTSDGNAAVAWGDRIDWSAEGLMDGYIDPELAEELDKEIQEYTYHTFTHETAHNIDARLFLKNHGRRFDAGGEDYADSNLMQSFGPNDIVMNLSVHFDKGAKVGSSWDPSRIDSPDEIQDYYSKVYQTIYVMDYIEAQAFLQLSSDVKAEIGIQVSYPNESKYVKDEYSRYRAYHTTAFEQKDAAYWENLKLDTIDDLVDKKIMIYPGTFKYSSRGDNSYGGEGINTVHWYQPNNPYGRPDSYALKWIAYEMMGLKGYQDGYVEYNSNIHSKQAKIYNDINNPSKGTKTVDYKTDSMALSRITNGEFSNFDDYKKARFEAVGKKLPYLNKKIDINKYVQEFYDALVKDSEHSKKRLEELLAAYKTDEQGCLNSYWCRHGIANDVRGYPNSTKVRQEIYYALKDLTNDFEGEIYENDIQQKDIDFKVKKADEEQETTINDKSTKEIISSIDDIEESDTEENSDNYINESIPEEDASEIIDEDESNSNSTEEDSIDSDLEDENSDDNLNEDEEITTDENNNKDVSEEPNDDSNYNSSLETEDDISDGNSPNPKSLMSNINNKFVDLEINSEENRLLKIKRLIFDNLFYFV